MSIDQAALGQFLGQFVGDLGATISAPLLILGDRLGLYKALAAHGPQTPAALAEHTGCSEAYLRPWLLNQAAGGYVTADASATTFWLTPEQAFCLADEDSPAFLPGGIVVALSTVHDVDKVEECFRTGAGLGWHEHHDSLYAGTERFFRPGYVGNLVGSWLPALDGVTDKLAAGARVADVGCGHGASTILMAEAYPASSFAGFDYHEASVATARKRAADAGVADRVSFEVAGAAEFPGSYDLVAFFDCLHDMGDPLGAARQAHDAIGPEGTLMVVEPFAGDSDADNLNPVGRVFYGASTTICTPSGLLGGGIGLGSQVSDATWAALLGEAGFTRFRRAAETPFNRVFEVRR
jgi:SAM-dependent methyltransferase